jgi:hypothetical protein
MPVLKENGDFLFLLSTLLERSATPKTPFQLPMRLPRFAKRCKTNKLRTDKEASS